MIEKEQYKDETSKWDIFLLAFLPVIIPILLILNAIVGKRE